MIALPGLRSDSPVAALALYGAVTLLGPTSKVAWGEGPTGWRALIDAEDLDTLAERLVSLIRAHPLAGLAQLAKDANELTPETWRGGLAHEVASVRAAVVGLCAEAPLRTGGRVAMSPLCVYNFGTRGTLFGNAVKQDESLTAEDLAKVLGGHGSPRRDVNTLGLDPAARRQVGAVMGADPSADGVRGVPGLVPLALRGLSRVAPLPHAGRVTGGAFPRGESCVEFVWPVFSTPTDARSLRLLAARDWSKRSPAQRAAAGVVAVYASRILRSEHRLSHGRRVA